MRPYFTTDLDNRLIAEDHDVPVLTLLTPRGDGLKLETTFYRDVVDEEFEIWPGIVIPPGDYGYLQFKPGFRTSPSRPLSAGFGFRYGKFYDGWRTDYTPSVSWRPSRYVNTALSYSINQVRLPQGDFEVRVLQFDLNLALTPDLTWSSLLQYDNKSDDIGLNSRLRWTWRPGNDVFLVVNQGWDYNHAHFDRLATDITFKVGATFRF